MTKAEAEGVVTVILEELGHNSQDDIEEDWGLIKYSRWWRWGDRRWQHEGGQEQQIGRWQTWGQACPERLTRHQGDVSNLCRVRLRGWRVEGVWNPFNSPENWGEQLWVLAVWEQMGHGGKRGMGESLFLERQQGGCRLLSLLNSGEAVRLTSH